ncbi:MAG TPA: glycosyltransferase family 2 protein [Nitrososphaeraceae archaeon]|jgi:beta-1,4-mannosyltransferase|nr:glycosyltransferase family 2 protein [Nitrososphaeraceae archaeon]
MVVITSFWFSTIPVAFLTLTRLLRNRRIFVETDLRRIHNDPEIIFQITTRSATRTPVVIRGVESIIESCSKVNYDSYEISVVTDDEKDKGTLSNHKCEVIVVEKEYSTNAIKKGRALQYAVEFRRKCAKNSLKQWVFHMDDESCVTTQTVLSLLKFIRSSGPAVVSEGPIFYPLKFEFANPLTAIAESIRPFTCYDCVSQMTNPPPLHMHGSNLLVRSDIEDMIGWNFGPTLAEDQLFGYKVYEKYGPKSLGWHGGILLEQPPLNIKDHFMQRRRWVLGSLQNMNKFPIIHKFKVMFKLSTYFLGFISGIVSIFLYFHLQFPKLLSLIPLHDIFSQTNIVSVGPKLNEVINTLSSESIFNTLSNGTATEITIGLMLIFPYILWLFSYQMGLFLNLQYSEIASKKRVFMHLQTLVLSILIGLVETFPAFYAMIEYCIGKRKDKNSNIKIYDFYVIEK